MNDFDEVDAFSSYARKIRAISDITARWAGHYVQTVVCQMDTDWPEGDLTLGFVEEGTPYTPVWLHLARIRYLRMEDLRETGPCFIDGVHVSLLPARRSDWPAEARMHTLRSWEGKWGQADLECEMVWITISGPWSLEVIAQIVNVSLTPPELTTISA
ncbi:hypothetical protein [Streptomyces sp. Ag109_O5-10]|uniref:hypothetical protein n=1 Tax=Streptomyces sp. Ag109_O5-10 TaxID=1855349 RepID=UPI00089D4F6F|nr:hypothetical protein [Streptomyces sp. Ag109_O5-10]SEE82121.1 hypothetical protein SAMN05216533_3834 [Streptomyces sp. Ag109_O5-10]